AFTDGSFDVITAIQCHHYLDEPARAATTRNCWRMLRPGGLYVEFENIRPLTPQGLQIGMQMWTTFQSNAGRTPDQITQHTNRFDTAYFPLTIPQHLELLKQSGFSAAEVLSASHLQAGFYAVK
ncbi:MAG: class I SAM-dependent methyltransferase, partial [Propionibacteriaceae bacterium]|nr:class I SAM-dependent methyltransferase [Propionibacteriaceae bacterium]